MKHVSYLAGMARIRSIRVCMPIVNSVANS